MAKEEYKKNLIRMFDSIRDECKGDESCTGIRCIDCPFDGKTCNIGAPNFRAYETLEIVEKWAKEHPIVTNAEKFKEVFGVDVSFDTCFTRPSLGSNCRECFYCNTDNNGCKVDKLFWEAEYKEPTKEGEMEERC